MLRYLKHKQVKIDWSLYSRLFTNYNKFLKVFVGERSSLIFIRRQKFFSSENGRGGGHQGEHPGSGASSPDTEPLLTDNRIHRN